MDKKEERLFYAAAIIASGYKARNSTMSSKELAKTCIEVAKEIENQILGF